MYLSEFYYQLFQIFKEHINQLNLTVKLINNHLCGHYEQISSKSYKEVIQPQVPLGLPCYDFTPVIDHSVVTAIPEGLS